MTQPSKRYKEMERYMTYGLIADAVLFVLYLICAGSGIIWLKVILAIMAMVLSGFCLFVLYRSKELLRQRSLWMSACAAAVLVCTLASLILNFPSPNKYKNDTNATESISASIVEIQL